MKKRFIAGATCPACGAVDKIYVLIREDGEKSQHCSKCDFSTSESDAGAETLEDPVRIAVIRLPEE